MNKPLEQFASPPTRPSQEHPLLRNRVAAEKVVVRNLVASREFRSATLTQLTPEHFQTDYWRALLCSYLETGRWAPEGYSYAEVSEKEWEHLRELVTAWEDNATHSNPPQKVAPYVEALLQAGTTSDPEDSTGETEDLPETVCGADIETKPTEWLWKPYLPLGKVSILEGDPGNGKTFLALTLAAAVTKGLGLPNAGTFEPQNILFLSSEDDPADTLNPRIEAAGADMSRVHYLRDWSTVSLQDEGKLRGLMERIRPALVIIDPITGFLGSNVDLYRDNEVRPVMGSLASIAQDFRCAVLGIRHLRKSAGNNAGHQGLGSIAFTASARSVLLVGIDPEGDPRVDRVLVQHKSNLGMRGDSLKFRVQGDEGAARVVWNGTSSASAEDLLQRRPEKEGVGKEAEEFLLGLLSDGPIEGKKVEEAAEDAFLNIRTVRRAAKKLDVVIERTKTVPAATLWTLPGCPRAEEKTPDHAPEAPQDSGPLFTKKERPNPFQHARLAKAREVAKDSPWGSR